MLTPGTEAGVLGKPALGVLSPGHEAALRARCHWGRPAARGAVRLRLCHLWQHQECVGTDRPNMGQL